ncbi:MAG: hypothetical protein K2P52_08420, partial [Campylobacterales bacterium]|nr:hypothetical protein [Campylobacterales bacterium]
MQVLDDNINLLAVTDSRLVFNDQFTYKVVTGGQEHTYRAFTPTSSSTNGLTFSCIPPSDLIAFSRQCYINLNANLTITATSTAAGQKIVDVNRCGVRQFPISSIIDNASLTLNGQKMNIQLARQVHPLGKYFFNDVEVGNTFLSGSPSAPDQSQEYVDLLGSVRNPLNNMYQTPINNYIGRQNGWVCSRNDLSTAGGQLLTAIININVFEPVFMNPFQYKHASSSFLHINTFDVNLTFLTTWPNRIWSSMGAAAGSSSVDIPINSIQGTINGIGSVNQCLFLTEFITPQETALLPRVLKYNYTELNPYITTGQTFGAYGSPTASGVIQSNQLQLSTVPRAIYIWVRQNFNSLSQNCQETDSYFSIEQLRIQWNNKDSIFSSANGLQLYSMCTESGLNINYREFAGEPVVSQFRTDAPGVVAAQQFFLPIGSVICLRFGVDIPCDALTAPGVVGNYSLSMQVSCTNLKKYSVTPELYISTQVDGILALAMAYANVKTALLTPTNIFSAIESQRMNPISNHDLSGVRGGDFWDALKNTMSDAHKFLRKHKILSTIAAGARELLPYIPAVGPLVGTVLAAIMGLLSGRPIKVIYAIIAMLIVQQVDNNL